jgi:hypothetical protein
MDVFLTPLKDAVRAKSWRWGLVCSGGRNAAFDGFRNAVQNGDDAVVVLLVDAEAPVNGAASAHLQARDGWDLGFASDQAVHLMVQTMEAWIVADPDALAAYYGQGFLKERPPQIAKSGNRRKGHTCDRARKRDKKDKDEGRVSQDPPCQRSTEADQPGKSAVAVSRLRAHVRGSG